MSMPEAVFHRPRSIPLSRRVLARVAVGAARLLASQSPRRIRTVLEFLRRGTKPATLEQARAARDAVTAVPRSLATILLCRLRGRWAAWCVGARRVPPFGAHAWVEVGGIPVGEDEYPPDYFRTFFTVP
jgi:hypothetical protein